MTNIIPQWNKHNTSITCIFSKIDDTLSLLVYDRDISEIEPVYMFALNDIILDVMKKIISNEINNTVEISGLSIADYQAWQDSGIMPIG